MSIGIPFSACMQMSAPSSRARCMPRKICPSSTKSTPGYAMNILNDVTPSLTSWPISSMVPSFTSVMIMWKRVVDGAPCPRPCRATCRGPCGADRPSSGWRSRRWTSCRRAPRRACRSRSRRSTVVPPNGMSRCVCASMPPGRTYLPGRVDGDVERAGGRRDPGAKMAAILSPSIATSAAYVSTAVTTVPPLMSVRVVWAMCPRE